MKPEIFLFILFYTVLSLLGVVSTMHPPTYQFNIPIITPIQNLNDIPLPNEMWSGTDLFQNNQNDKIPNFSRAKENPQQINKEIVLEMNKFPNGIAENKIMAQLNEEITSLPPSTGNNKSKVTITTSYISTGNQSRIPIDLVNNDTFYQSNSEGVEKIPDLRSEKNDNHKISDNGIKSSQNSTSKHHHDLMVKHSYNLESVSVPSDKEKFENTTQGIFSQPKGVERTFLDKNIHKHTNGTRECCDGKYSEIVYSKILKEEVKEEKINDNYLKQHSNYSPVQPDMNYDNSIDINKENSNFRQIKLLMLKYIESLNNEQVNNISVMQSIAQSQNVLELIERLNKVFKEAKKTTEDPTGFIKAIADKQIDKCEEIYTESEARIQSFDITLAKIENNKNIMRFLKCVNVNFKKCLRNFAIWLKSKKFYLRPRFEVKKAYKTFERIYSFSCL